MKILEVAACTALVLVSIPSGAAQPASQSQFKSHSSPVRHSYPLQAGGSKNLPRSTAPVNLCVTGKSARAYSMGIDRLERQSVSQLQRASRQGGRSAYPAHMVRSQTPDHGSSNHGSTINFSYRSPQAAPTSRSSASAGRRR